MPANRSPPMWETSQVSSGYAAESVAAIGRPCSAQQASCLPWVQTSSERLVGRHQAGRAAGAERLEVEAEQVLGAVEDGGLQPAHVDARVEPGPGGVHAEAAARCAPVEAPDEQGSHPCAGRGGAETLLDRGREPAVADGVHAPGPGVLDQQEGPDGRGRSRDFVPAVEPGDGAAESRIPVHSPITSLRLTPRPREAPPGRGGAPAPGCSRRRDPGRPASG